MIYPIKQERQWEELDPVVKTADDPRELPGEDFHPYVCVSHDEQWNALYIESIHGPESNLVADSLDQAIENAVFMARTYDVPLVLDGFGDASLIPSSERVSDKVSA